MDQRLLGILACPICYGKLSLNKQTNELICKIDSLAFPIRDDIPVLLKNEARKLTSEEKSS